MSNVYFKPITLALGDNIVVKLRMSRIIIQNQ